MRAFAHVALLMLGMLWISGDAALGASDAAPATDVRAEMIGEGVISTQDDEFGGSLTADGKTLYFDRSVPAHYLYTMWMSEKKDGRWSKPQMLPFSGQYRDSDPVLTPSGKTLLFASDRPVNGVDQHHYYIWAVDRAGSRWATPRRLGGPVNGDGSQVFSSMAVNGDLYFNSDRGDGNYQVYRSRFVRGEYQPAEKLGPTIDSEGSYIAEAFIAPDESYMLLGIYASPDGFGSYDIYISYNNHDRWSYPINVGPEVNTPAREYSPRVTPDGKYLIFTSERGFGSHRPDKPIKYDEFVTGVRGVLNGLGNIYRIDMSYIIKTTRQKARF